MVYFFVNTCVPECQPRVRCPTLGLLSGTRDSCDHKEPAVAIPPLLWGLAAAAWRVFLKAWLGMEQLFPSPMGCPVLCDRHIHIHLDPESSSLLPTPHPGDPVTKLLLGTSLKCCGAAAAQILQLRDVHLPKERPDPKAGSAEFPVLSWCWRLLVPAWGTGGVPGGVPVPAGAEPCPLPTDSR